MNAALQLLLTLTGVTLLFACAQSNGAMERVAGRALALCQGRRALLAPVIFLLAALLATVGPGAILSTALVAPLAMPAGVRAGLSPFLVALMIGNGANAGNLSPFSTVGAIVSTLMERASLGGHAYRIWAFHALAHALAAAAAYLAFGGWRAPAAPALDLAPAPLEARHRFTLLVTLAWILAILFARVPLGPSGFAAAAVILAFRWADPRAALRLMPWKVILLVTSISTAIGLLERAGGLAWFQDLLARHADAGSIHALIAFLTGAISAYSSTSGVVLPAFLPMAPGIAARLPGTDPVALAISIVVSSALVDVSPLSTIGALAIAAAPREASSGLFRKLLFWGFAMAFAGAAYCWLGAPWFQP